MHASIQILASVIIAMLMFHVGLQASFESIMSALREGSLLTRALLVNFIVIPLLALGLCNLLHVAPGVEVGILLMACAPGVPFLPVSAGRAKGGRLNFAIGLVFIFAFLSVITVPVTVDAILPAGYVAKLPVGRFLTTLVLFQLVPLLLGILLNRTNTALSERLFRVTAGAILVLVLAFFAVLAVPFAHAIGTVYGSRGLLTIIVLVLLSMLAGWAAGGPDRPSRVTLTLGSGLRNPGIGFLIAATSFSGTIVVPSVMSYFVLQALLGALVGLYFRHVLKQFQTNSQPAAVGGR